jgi:uncharacterized protein (UPF0276 family)
MNEYDMIGFHNSICSEEGYASDLNALPRSTAPINRTLHSAVRYSVLTFLPRIVAVENPSLALLLVTQVIPSLARTVVQIEDLPNAIRTHIVNM